MRHQPRLPEILRVLVVLGAITLTACTAETDAGATDPTSPTPASDGGSGQPAEPTPPPTTQGSASVDLDACALATQEEVESIVGMPVGAPAPEDAPPPFFGCRYEDDDILPVVTVGIIASDSAEDATSLFELGADQYTAVEGVGDRAYRSQPIGEITVLAGRYELSVDLYFVSEDDDIEFEMGRQLAELILPRLHD